MALTGLLAAAAALTGWRVDRTWLLVAAALAGATPAEDVPLIQKGPVSGQFKLTLGIQKSGDLLHFSPFSFIPGQTVINGNGELEFTFGVPDNAAFFRLEAH